MSLGLGEEGLIMLSGRLVRIRATDTITREVDAAITPRGRDRWIGLPVLTFSVYWALSSLRKS